MNIPNSLTILRLVLIPVFVAFVFLEISGLTQINNFIACGIFLLASFTDFLDGYLARKWNQVTDFGKLFDPAADKLLCGSALIMLVYVFATTETTSSQSIFTMFITIFAIVIICRELFITAFRSMAAKKGIIMAADLPGKIKTFTQMIGIAALLIVPDVVLLSKFAGDIVFYVGFGVLAFGTVMALLSCLLYLVKYKQVFVETK